MNMEEMIREGWMVFVSDGEAGIGSVRGIVAGGRPELLVYVENAGDFTVPLVAVKEVQDGKVILDRSRLTPGLLAAIGHAHDAEDDTYDAVVEGVEPPAPAGEAVPTEPPGQGPETALEPAFIERQRQRLQALRAELVGEEGERTRDARDYQETHGRDSPELEERAQDLAQGEIRQARYDADIRRLRQIDRALKKIDEGSYGRSDASGEPIPRARLEITPEAVLTVEEEEQREG
ncbi:MAG: hypothetical protein WA924_01360 [Burkholderiaceae bacterium]